MAYVPADMGRAARMASQNRQFKSGGRGGFQRTPFDKEKWYTLKDGKNTLRILPRGFDDVSFIPGPDWGWVVAEHRNLPGSEPNEKVRCIKRTYPESGEPCVICGALSQLEEWFREAGLTDAEKKGKRKGIYLQRRAYVNAIVRGDSLTQDVEYKGKSYTIPKIRIVGLPVSQVYDYLTEQMVETNTDGSYIIGDFMNPSRGRDIRITRSGMGLDTEYTVLPLDRSELHEDERVSEAIMANAHVLSDVFRYPNAEKLARAKVLADEILKLIDDQPRAEEDPVGEIDPEETFAEVREAPKPVAVAKGKNRPACYGNHVTRFKKCMVCPVELNCEDESADKDIEERKAVHGEA